MQAPEVLRSARRRARMSQRALAAAAGTSPGTVAAYEGGSKVPTVATLDRLVQAAGFELGWSLVPGGRARLVDRGEQLAAVLELTDHLPARASRRLGYPPFSSRRWPSSA